MDRQCGSSQQAVHFAAAGLVAGHYDIVVAGGVEAMSLIPMGAGIGKDVGFPYPPSVLERYDVPTFNQGIGAEMMAAKWGFDRTALRHLRRAVARAPGRRGGRRPA
jgi:acetyl-CoA acyltransferase